MWLDNIFWTFSVNNPAIGSGGAAPLTVSNVLGSELLSYFDFGDQSSITQSGGFASAWADQGPRGRSVSQATGANQPAVSASPGELQFDGSNDILFEPDLAITQTASQVLPDGNNNDGPGTGFSSTGLAYDHVTGGWVIGNDGQNFQTGGQSASIVFTNFAADTKTAEILLKPIFPSIGTVQGVAVDPSDGHIWFASTAENLIRKINRSTGASITSIAKTAPNGLAIASDGTLWYTQVSTAFHIEQDGTQLQSFAISADGIWLDEARNWLWGFEGNVNIYDIEAGVLITGVAPSIATNNSEGIWNIDDTLYLISNDSFHVGPPSVSTLYTASTTGVSALARPAYLDLWWVGNVATTTATNLILGFGDPLTSTGWGVYAPIGDATIRAIISAVTTNFTTTPTTRGIWHLSVDCVLEQASLYLNGALVATNSIAAISGGRIRSLSARIGASIETGPTRFSTARISAVVQRGAESAVSTTQRQKIEGILAWDYGLEGLLDGAHPYKSSRP